MRSQTLLRRHLEPGWLIRAPNPPTDDPLTGNPRPRTWSDTPVAVSIQERLLTGMREIAPGSVVDERIAIVLPAEAGDPLLDISAEAVLISPAGEAWNAIGEGRIRRTAHRKGMYSIVSVRRAKESDITREESP